MTDKRLEYTYRQITAHRAVDGTNFPLGLQEFNWSIGGRNSWIPAESYFRIGLTIKGEGGTMPKQNEYLAFD